MQMTGKERWNKDEARLPGGQRTRQYARLHSVFAKRSGVCPCFPKQQSCCLRLQRCRSAPERVGECLPLSVDLDACVPAVCIATIVVLLALVDSDVLFFPYTSLWAAAVFFCDPDVLACVLVACTGSSLLRTAAFPFSFDSDLFLKLDIA